MDDDFAGFGATYRCSEGHFVLGDILDFKELGEGLCAFQLFDNPTDMSRLQIMSWDSKRKLPKALGAFLHSNWTKDDMQSEVYEDSDSD